MIRQEIPTKQPFYNVQGGKRKSLIMSTNDELSFVQNVYLIRTVK